MTEEACSTGKHLDENSCPSAEGGVGRNLEAILDGTEWHHKSNNKRMCNTSADGVWTRMNDRMRQEDNQKQSVGNTASTFSRHQIGATNVDG